MAASSGGLRNLVAVQSGASGIVYRDDSDPDNIKAVKVMPLGTGALKEIRALQVLRHPNIVPVLGFEENKEKNTISIIMPYIPVTLLNLLQQSVSGSLTEGRTRNYFLQMLSALEYIHDNGFVHKDIKLENVLIDEETNHCYLADFGMAEQFDGVTFLQDNFGSLHYSAPEIWENLPYRGPEVDIWGLGVTLYLMVTGVFPFGGTTPAEVAAEILEYDIWFPPDLTRDLQDLIMKMLSRNIRTRITIPEIREHPWIVKGIRNRMLGFGAQAAAVISSSFSPMDHETTKLFHEALKAAVSPEVMLSPRLQHAKKASSSSSSSSSKRSKKKKSKKVLGLVSRSVHGSSDFAPAGSLRASEREKSYSSEPVRLGRPDAGSRPISSTSSKSSRSHSKHDSSSKKSSSSSKKKLSSSSSSTSSSTSSEHKNGSTPTTSLNSPPSSPPSSPLSPPKSPRRRKSSRGTSKSSSIITSRPSTASSLLSVPVTPPLTIESGFN